MTAGHCVFNKCLRSWNQSIDVIPGMDEHMRPYGSAASSDFRSVSQWTKRFLVTHDYGCIVLPEEEPLGIKTGWWGFASLSTRALRRLLVNNSGYPHDKPFGTQWFNGGRITRVSPHRLYYMLDTMGGHSGSPIWRSKDGVRHAVGIHAYGGCPNKSVRIDKNVFARMKKWKAEGQST